VAPTYTGLAFPVAADGWLIGTPATSNGTSTGTRAGTSTGTSSAKASIWHTTTAGATWQVQWRGAGTPLSVTATDTAHAWALIGCPSPGQRSCLKELLGTADGGQHWQVLTRLPDTVTQIQFASDNLGIATTDPCLTDSELSRCPGQVLISRDGGTSWTPVLSTASPVFATAAVSAGGDRLWAAEAFPGAGGYKNPRATEVKLLTSTDGGRSWRQLSQWSQQILGGQITTAVKVTLAATSAGLSLATVFDQGTCAMHGCGVADLLQSSDGGRTWSRASLADTSADLCGFDGMLSSVAPGGAEWAAAGHNGGACSPPFGLLYQRGPSGWRQLTPWQLTGISSVSAVSTDVAYAISDSDALARTEDGGRTWTQLVPAPVPAGQIDALSATTALGAQDASNAGAILRSGNGGQSWRQVANLPGTVLQLDFPSASNGIAVTYQAGNQGYSELWRSTDGGLTWRQLGRLPGDAGFGNTGSFGPWMSADGHGVLLTAAQMLPWQGASGGGNPARLWTTTDWGAHWTQDSLLTPADDDTLISSASFTESGTGTWTGWLAGGSQIFATSTGALTPVPGSPSVTGAQLLSPGAGIARGLSGGQSGTNFVLSIYRTTDNGQHWQQFRTPVTLPPLNQQVLLSFSDINHGWLVIGNSTWRTADGGRTWSRG